MRTDPAASLLTLAVLAPLSAQSIESFSQAQAFLKTYCSPCHQGNSPAGGFHVNRVSTEGSLSGETRTWNLLHSRVSNYEMPPKGAGAPDIEQRERFTQWVGASVRAAACAGGAAPGSAPIRRLNRDEYAATMRDLLDIHMDIGQALPAEGAGGEGFDNAAETLFVSPLHSEKYMEVARFVLDFAATEFKSRAKIFTAEPGPGVPAGLAARRIFENFLPRAFRRPVSEADVAPYMALFQAARKDGQPFDAAILFSLRGALVSPMFLFRSEPPNRAAEPQPLNQFALASRLSYFLWGSMPDEFLFDIAAEGKLHDPEVLRHLTGRMLRSDRSLAFVQRFVEQWLRTRELTGDKAPDAALFPAYAADEELRSDIRLQPVLFFRELLLRNLSLLELIDSTHTIGTSNLEKHYSLKLPLRANARKQPHWVELPENSQRGGLLGMSAVLIVSSYPYRTSPVLRGAWIMESLLGTPPPPPPPDVPELEQPREGAPPQSMRERLARHRADAACASCHNRIDPLGYALENFDAIGRWRDHEGGVPIDASAELAGGVRFHGSDQLRDFLLERKDLFLRNLTTKMLGYALGRGLTLSDSCTVDNILARLKDNNYQAQTLIEEIILSMPFRYQAARPPN